MEVRTAIEADAAVRTLAAAFFADPVWGWAFAGDEQRIAQHRDWFGLLVHSAIGNGSVYATPGIEAVAVWVPPGRAELDPSDEARLGPLIAETAGARAPLIMDVFDRFEAAHPHGPEHYYLSLLGTDPHYRGHGFGMALLAENLTRVDAEGAPAYLESTNPINQARYEGLGFQVYGSFELPDDGPSVTQMWREPRR